MSALVENSFDRRLNPRTFINSQIQYQLDDDNTLHTGTLLDVSQNGVQISLDHALSVGTSLKLIMQDENPLEEIPPREPIQIIAEIVRITDEQARPQYGYGCKVLEVLD